MTRDVLSQMLAAAEGVEGSDGSFSCHDDHQVSFYLGEDARGLVVNEVARVRLHDSFAELATREQGVIYAPFESLQALAVRPAKGGASRRTGFE